MLKLQIKIGAGMLSFEGADLKAICKGSALLGLIPSQCDVCQGKDIHLTHKSPGGNDYYGVKCACGAELNFHQRKEGGSFYIIQGEKMTVYTPEQGQQPQQQQAQKPADPQEPFEDDIPF